MSGRNLPRSLACLRNCLPDLVRISLWTGPTGGRSLIRDITGGAAIIFRAPKDPVVHIAGAVQNVGVVED
jgi:hypothetical protein